MASSTVIPVSEYLNTSYRPDRDYLDGELKERNMGEQPHARLQMILGRIFDVKRREWGIRVLAEQRIQTSAEHYRIADVCVLRSSDPKDPIVRFAPLLCVEILSKDDSVGELQERVNDYAGLGVEHIWTIEPWKRLGYVASRRGFVQPADGVLRIAGTAIEVSLAELFAELDES